MSGCDMCGGKGWVADTTACPDCTMTPMQMIEEMGGCDVYAQFDDWVALKVIRGTGRDGLFSGHGDSPEAAVRALYDKWKEAQ